MQQVFGRFFWIFLIFSIPKMVSAQEGALRGLIVVDFRDMDAEGVLITNRTTKISAISDMTGSFSIQVSVGDTLFLQGAFLEDRKFVVRKNSFTYNPLVIHMNQEVIALKDLIVKAPLTGDLQKDIKSVKIRDDVEKLYKNLGIDIRTLDMKPKEKKADVLPKIAGIPIPTSLNIEALYKSISGYYRRMENLNQFERLEQRLNDVKAYLGVTYFEEIIGIPENEIHGFLLYVYDHSGRKYESYYLQEDYLSMDHLLRSKAELYRKRLKKRDEK